MSKFAPTPEYLSQVTAHNGAFSREVPGLQLVWDSTSIGELKQCPQKYYQTMVLGYTTSKQNFHLTFGIYYHSALEHYDKAIAAGTPHEDALVSTLAYTLELSGDRDEAGHFRPWESEDKLKNRFNLIRSVIWYIDYHHENNSMLPAVVLANGKAAVELSFKFSPEITSELSGQPYFLSGHLDKLAYFGDSVVLTDRKSTKSTLNSQYFSNYSPDNQMSLYAIAARVVFNQEIRDIIIDAVQVAVNFSSFGRGPVNRTPTILNQWLEDLEILLAQNETYARNRHWPKNDKSCFNCPFKPVCSHDPAIAESIRQSRFAKKTWDPTISRET